MLGLLPKLQQKMSENTESFNSNKLKSCAKWSEIPELNNTKHCRKAFKVGSGGKFSRLWVKALNGLGPESLQNIGFLVCKLPPKAKNNLNSTKVSGFYQRNRTPIYFPGAQPRTNILSRIQKTWWRYVKTMNKEGGRSAGRTIDYVWLISRGWHSVVWRGVREILTLASLASAW